MSATDDSIIYPRRRLARSAIRRGGQLLLDSAFPLDYNGRDHFPPGRILIFASNHVAVMEGALMAVLTPCQVEFLGTADIPHKRSSQLLIDRHGATPLHRGAVDRPAMRQAQTVGAQGGVPRSPRPTRSTSRVGDRQLSP
jgi:hypothetical protein